MSFDALLTLAVVVLLFIALIKDLAPPDLVFLGATALLALFGIISPAEAFAGFSNSGMLTVAVLFVVATGLRETGVLDYVGHHILGRAKSEKGVLARLALVVSPMSAFLNNTPVVALFVPIVLAWSRRHQVSPSKLLIPLSFLAILGGTCTLIGTSTNLVVNGLMVENGIPGMGLFEIGMIGLPYAAIGLAYLLFVGQRMLPDRKDLLEQLGEARREYVIQMLVQPGCRLIGQTVEAAGLSHMADLVLSRIDRDTKTITPAEPSDVIQENDRLVFTGILNSILDLKKIPGLVPIADPAYVVSFKEQRQRRLCEVVLSGTSPLIGKTITESAFQECCDAAVVAVHRHGNRFEHEIDKLELRPGDTLLLQTGTNFYRMFRNNPAFYLVSDVEEWRPLRRDRAWIAGTLFFMLIVLMTTGLVPTLIAATLTAVLMVVTGCISPVDARRSVEWQVLITIASAFGVGTALQNSGVATAIAGELVRATEPWGPIAALAAIYFVGSIMTELITNNAAAVLLFPFCLETAKLYNVSPRPFLMALALAASASFMTPIGYQTNMMVYGPGGYFFSDFLRIGALLNALLMIVAVMLIPFIWPL